MTMKFKTKLLGVKEVMDNLEEIVDALGGSPEAVVGFGTDYAVPVHERVEAFHPIGSAKFLEIPFNDIRRGYRENLSRRIAKFMRTGHPHPLAAALYEMALIVDKNAVSLTPVDTGRLRASHFVVPPDGVSDAGQAPTTPGGE